MKEIVYAVLLLILIFIVYDPDCRHLKRDKLSGDVLDEYKQLQHAACSGYDKVLNTSMLIAIPVLVGIIVWKLVERVL
ncbi:hypothetical protein [Thiomicrospira microaerophila]|uniref:hypothetical protein n=1 Tax=Thiomicrospira microaerophila TaxID=406020 RepID=UPI0005CACCCA|nr:hypothetical protein [Thiomicrospira microaerophila]